MHPSCGSREKIAQFLSANSSRRQYCLNFLIWRWPYANSPAFEPLSMSSYALFSCADHLSVLSTKYGELVVDGCIFRFLCANADDFALFAQQLLHVEQVRHQALLSAL